MARPLQKKKNKSSLPRVRQKTKSKRINIKSNPIIAANWDQSLTLSQNYRRLGLSSKLNSSSGGVEAKVRNGENDSQADEGRDPLAITGKIRGGKAELGSVRVVRDAEGKITGVVRDKEQTTRNPLGDPLTELEDREGEDEGQRAGRATGIVAQLEEASQFEKKKRPRKQSQREEEWLGSLVEKWGDDVGAMARDRKLNPMQQSEGDLRKRVHLWQKSRRRTDEEDMEEG